MNELLSDVCIYPGHFLFYFLFPQQSSFSGFVPLKVLLMSGIGHSLVLIKGQQFFSLTVYMWLHLCTSEKRLLSHILCLDWGLSFSGSDSSHLYLCSYATLRECRLPSASFLWQTCYLKNRTQTSWHQVKLRVAFKYFFFFRSYGDEDGREYFDLTLEDIERLNLHCLRWDCPTESKQQDVYNGFYLASAS